MTTDAKGRQEMLGDIKEWGRGHRRNDEPCEENNKKQLAHCFFQFP
jgi:hypothetical protein